ncbi:hypothetical protein IV01_14545 [Pseudomonas syringae]|uniref:Uncharacterized protein n=1 Tax=Pseudomonas syringae TaxID=317 RepID=A0A085VH80_PSESX|nr:hypothetical protein IV01_14545 [Pseudomonas syringae]
MPSNQATRITRHTAFTFIAGKRAPTDERRNLWERCLPAIWATRFFRQTALSFITSKLGSYRFGVLALGRVGGRHKQVGCQAASRAFDLQRPVKTRWPGADIDSAGKPAWMPV